MTRVLTALGTLCLLLTVAAWPQSPTMPVGQLVGSGAPTMNCLVGQIYHRTDATAGYNKYLCTALPNTWTQQNAATATVATGIPSYTVAGLPAAGTAGRVARVTDSSTAGSCTAGAGSFVTICLDTGAAWAPATVAQSAALSVDPAACAANNWVTDISAAGTLTCSQPASTNLSDSSGLVRGAASLTTDHKVVSVSTTDGTLEEIPNQTANTVYGGPSSGAAAAPSFRALVVADVPTATPSWRKYALVAIANGVNGCANANGCWQINGVLGANKAAALTQAVTLFTAPASYFVSGVSIKTGTQCTGATTATSGLGTASSVGLFVAAAAYDIAAAVSNTNLYNALAAPGRATAASEAVNADLITTVANIDQLVTGCAVDYWVLWGVLP